MSRFLSFSKFFLTAKLDNYSNKILGHTDWSQLGGRDLTCADAAAWEALKARRAALDWSYCRLFLFSVSGSEALSSLSKL